MKNGSYEYFLGIFGECLLKTTTVWVGGSGGQFGCFQDFSSVMENWDPFCEAWGRMDGLWISTNQT